VCLFNTFDILDICVLCVLHDSIKVIYYYYYYAIQYFHFCQNFKNIIFAEILKIVAEF